MYATVAYEHNLAIEIAANWRMGSVLVVGPSSADKTGALRDAAAMLSNDDRAAIEFAGSTYTDLEDLIGRNTMVTKPDGQKEARFTPGPLSEAMREGRRFILVDADRLIGYARAAILAVLQGRALPPARVGHVTTLIRPGFSLAATASRQDFELTDSFGRVIEIH